MRKLDFLVPTCREEALTLFFWLARIKILSISHTLSCTKAGIN